MPTLDKTTGLRSTYDFSRGISGRGNEKDTSVGPVDKADKKPELKTPEVKTPHAPEAALKVPAAVELKAPVAGAQDAATNSKDKTIDNTTPVLVEVKKRSILGGLALGLGCVTGTLGGIGGVLAGLVMGVTWPIAAPIAAVCFALAAFSTALVSRGFFSKSTVELTELQKPATPAPAPAE